MLDRCDVDVVDGGEIKDYSFESGLVGINRGGVAAARPRVVPWAVLP